MKIDKATIQKIAHLARLEFQDHAEEEMLKDLNKIVSWVEKLQELDTANVEPLTHMSTELNVLRDDVVKEPLHHDRGLLNAPRKDSDYFRVPKVME
jgi:aspartyl-tRNA(Asn)/glutamyl-tRNA(Gln) amidotransferase subunit C